MIHKVEALNYAGIMLSIYLVLYCIVWNGTIFVLLHLIYKLVEEMSTHLNLCSVQKSPLYQFVPQTVNIMDVATMKTSIGFWTPVLKPQVRHVTCCSLIFGSQK